MFILPQILGFDILLMKNLKPILLEVNANPSMRIEHEQEVSILSISLNILPGKLNIPTLLAAPLAKQDSTLSDLPGQVLSLPK